MAGTWEPIGDSTSPRHSQSLFSTLSSPLQLLLADKGNHMTKPEQAENNYVYTSYTSFLLRLGGGGNISED